MDDRPRISFATADDAEWLIANDSNEHISAARVREKVGRQEYVVARLGNQYVGYVRLSHFWSFIPFIDIIAVEDDHQRRGIGRAMLNVVETRARAEGHTMILSSSQADEPGPQAWHRKVGFHDAGAVIDLRPLQNVPEILFIKRIDQA